MSRQTSLCRSLLAGIAAFVLASVHAGSSASIQLGSDAGAVPDVLGVPLAVLAPELPQGTLAEGESARFEIEFLVNLRGAVTSQKMIASSHPKVDGLVLKQHAQWLYSVATRAEPCVVTRYRGLQRVVIERRNGDLVAALDPADVIEKLDRTDYPRELKRLGIANYREVMSRMQYPPVALRAGVEGELVLLVEFAEDGTVRDVFPVNAAYDKWGFANAAIQALRQLRASDATTPIRACIPVAFRIR